MRNSFRPSGTGLQHQIERGGRRTAELAESGGDSGEAVV